MDISGVQEKLDSVTRKLTPLLGSSLKETVELGEKDLQKLIQEMRDIKSAGESIMHSAEKIKEKLKSVSQS